MCNYIYIPLCVVAVVVVVIDVVVVVVSDVVLVVEVVLVDVVEVIVVEVVDVVSLFRSPPKYNPRRMPNTVPDTNRQSTTLAMNCAYRPDISQHL